MRVILRILFGIFGLTAWLFNAIIIARFTLERFSPRLTGLGPGLSSCLPAGRGRKRRLKVQFIILERWLSWSKAAHC